MSILCTPERSLVNSNVSTKNSVSVLSPMKNFMSIILHLRRIPCQSYYTSEEFNVNHTAPLKNSMLIILHFWKIPCQSYCTSGKFNVNHTEPLTNSMSIILLSKELYMSITMHLWRISCQALPHRWTISYPTARLKSSCQLSIAPWRITAILDRYAAEIKWNSRVIEK